VWFANVNQQYGWIPAADANRVYVYMGSASASPGPQTGTLFGYDRSSGARTVSIVNGDDRFTTYNGTPFVGGQNDVLAFTVGSAGYTLVSFNVANNSVNWRTPGNFSSYLAVDDGLLFVPNGIELTVLSESTGSQLQHWFAPPGESLDGNLVVTDNIVFVATSGGSYGIDRSSMQTVWHSTIKGELAFGDGMLLITNPNAVYAFAVPEAPSFVLAIVPIAALIGLRRRRSC
jgi:outer membrane protein assembly factor BamB